jgi:hypothetical protein
VLRRVCATTDRSIRGVSKGARGGV